MAIAPPTVTGIQLASIRRNLGASLEAVAAYAGVHRTTIRRAERASTIDQDTADVLLGALGRLAADRSAQRRRIAKELLLAGAALLVQDAQESLTSQENETHEQD